MNDMLTFFEIESGGIPFIKKQDNSLEYLLIYREKMDDYTFPKGHVEHKESLENSAIREIKEEAGVEVTLSCLIDIFEYKVKEKRKDGSKAFFIRRVYNYLAEVLNQDFEFKNPDLKEGLTCVSWFNYMDAYQKLTYVSNKESLAKANMLLLKETMTYKEIIGYIYDIVLTRLISDKEINSHLTHVGKVGSFNDGEVIDNWSDLDVMLIIKSDEYGNIPNAVILKLKDVHMDISSMYPGIEISFLTHTLIDFKKYVEFNYLNTYSFATYDYNPTNFDIKKYINSLVKERNLNNSLEIRSIAYHMRHLRFNTVRLIASNYHGNKGSAKVIIDKLVESSILFVRLYGQTIQGKKERINFIKENVDDKKILFIYDRVINLREEWNSFTETDYISIINEGLGMLEYVATYFDKKYSDATPEELMNM